MSEAPQPGTVLAGKYRVERVLGVGGMGVVVAATHVQLDQRVAIKYLRPAAQANPEVVERFAREARTAAKIRGEHVARVIDVAAFDDGTPFMVLEYLEGHDLSVELENKGPLEVVEAVRYLLETCEALAEAHVAKVVHRDLKPANLFLAVQPDKRTIIKVLDFGISRSVEPGVATLTATSAVLGTVFYMSPEQLASSKEIDHRADIWSLGVILYQLLTARRPFEGETLAAVILTVLQNEPVPVRTLRPDLPEGLAAAIAGCLTGPVTDRFQDVGELAAALAPYADARDRGSVESILRVLGTTRRLAPLTGPATTANEAPGLVAGLAASAPPPGDELASAKTALLPLLPEAPSSAAPSEPGASPTSAKPRPWLPIAAAGLVLLAGAGLAAARMSGTPRAATEPPAPPPSAATNALPTASVSGAAVATIETAAPPPGAAPDAATTHSAASGTPKPRPSAVAAAAPQATAPAASAATAPAPVASTKNPLQMGLK